MLVSCFHPVEHAEHKLPCEPSRDKFDITFLLVDIDGCH